MSFPYKFPPMTNQVRALKRAWPLREFALFHEMGTGKTFTTINLAAARFLKEQINAVVVLCPTAIKLVWKHELEKICPVDYDFFVMEAGKHKQAQEFIDFKSPRLKFFILGIESLSQGKAHLLATEFAKTHNTMAVVDESSTIKNHKSERTKRAISVGGASDFRLILTGTPISQGVEDLFGQFAFLNTGIIDCKSYFVFKNMYCIMGGFQGKKILGYQNEDALIDQVAPYVDQAYKKDVMDLPDKVFEKRMVEPTKEQMVAIKDLKDVFEVEVGGDLLTTTTVLTRLTRFQQIIGGNFPFDDQDEGGFKSKPMTGKNPKLEELANVIDEIPHNASVVVWARFRPEISLICQLISAKTGIRPLEFHGGVSEESREQAVLDFEAGRNRFFVSNQQTGGMGLTLVRGTYVIYYSNDFSYLNRVQSEDRCHRKGQTNKVTYIDIEANHPYDKMILTAITKKGGVAKSVQEEIDRHNRT